MIGKKDGCEPTPTPTPTPEPTPDRIVNTGPVEIVMAVIVVLGIAGGGFYLYRTRKTLKTVEKGVSGKATESEATAKSAESSQEASKTTEKADEPKSSEPTQKA